MREEPNNLGKEAEKKEGEKKKFTRKLTPGIAASP